MSLPYLILPCLALPCLALPCLALPCLALPCLTLPCLALPCLAWPCLAMPCLAWPCLAWPCLAMPCHALPCLALPCLATCSLLLFLISLPLFGFHDGFLINHLLCASYLLFSNSPLHYSTHLFPSLVFTSPSSSTFEFSESSLFSYLLAGCHSPPSTQSITTNGFSSL